MFTTDSRAEQFLGFIGAKWHYSNDLTFDDLLPKWEAENLGRSQPKDDEAVAEYGAQMDEGSAAPAPIVAFIRKLKKYVVLDGVQRLLAAELRKALKWSGYIVETDSDAMLTKIRIFANYKLQGSHQEPGEFTLGQAVRLLILPGIMSATEVTAMGGWKPAVVRDKLYVIQYGLLISEAGGPASLSDTMIRVISQHAEEEDFKVASVPLTEFFKDLKKMQLTTDAATPHIERFFHFPQGKTRTFKQFEKRLKVHRVDEDVITTLADPQRAKKVEMTTEAKLRQSLKGSLTTVSNALEAGVPIANVQECVAILGQTKSKLERLGKIRKKR